LLLLHPRRFRWHPLHPRPRLLPLLLKLKSLRPFVTPRP